MKHKYTWKECGIATIVFCVFLYLVSLPYHKYEEYGYQYEDVYSKIEAIKQEKEDSIDVVYLGDSQAWATYSPIQMYGEYGFTSLNCATAGQFPPDSYVVLKNVFKTQSPKVVVMDSNMIYSSLNYFKAILKEVFPIFHYHNVSTLETKGEYFGLKGFNWNFSVVPYTGRTDYMNQENDTRISLYNSQALDKIVELCKENHTTLILVSSIAPLCWSNGRHDVVNEFCEENNLEFIDYNEDDLSKEIGIDFNNDFRDGGDHLNFNGSRKLCHNLGEKLQTKYNLTDHRNDSSYKDWNELYENTQEYQS